jgi:hypothetical protein
LAFTTAGLNDLDVHAADMSNACLCVPCHEKMWTVVVRALCGLKSSGTSWKAVLAQSLTHIGCKSTRADPDGAWIRAAFKPDGHAQRDVGRRRAETDVTPELSDNLANRCQQLIGALRWACELGRIDILFKISLLASHTAMPRWGHLEAAWHVFAHLKQHLNLTLVFDERLPEINEGYFTQVDWKGFCGNEKEEMPPKMPKARGNLVRISCFVDADHAGNVMTRRSHTGILVFMNNALISWFSKLQNTVECSTFGSEFVALHIAVKQMEALRYKLRMFGVPIDGPADQSVVDSSSLPQRTLQKKHNAICFHKVLESVAVDVIRVAKIDGTENWRICSRKSSQQLQGRSIWNRFATKRLAG